MSGVKCDICPHHCKTDYGICGNRLANMGKFSAIHMDPVEKKPLYHIYPGSQTLSLGSVGCNLKCPWCQNWNISKEYKDLKLTELTPKELLLFSKNKGISSVTFTYNEPSISFEYVAEASELLMRENIRTYIVSSGYLSDKYLEPFYKNITAVNIDLKTFNKQNYKKIIGGDLDTVLNTLKFLKNSRVWLEITTLLIPGFNDTDNEINRLIDWIGNELGPFIPLHFSAYYPCYQYKANKTPDTTILNAVKAAKAKGLKYVYSGNILNGKTSTFCKNCGTILVSREDNTINSYIIDGKCPNCATSLDGVY